MGGEKFVLVVVSMLTSGSPPRGRGKVYLGPQLGAWDGITPAWAGKSTTPRRQTPSFGDHPRVGGEKIPTVCQATHVQGSPPRGRGKDVRQVGAVCGRGITPAWAGKRCSSGRCCMRKRDHPRVGGEKGWGLGLKASWRGSPPRGRGKVVPDSAVRCDMRITPAWAGKRLKRSHRSGIFISGPIPFHSVLHRPAGSGGSRAGRDGSPAGQPQNTGPA